MQRTFLLALLFMLPAIAHPTAQTAAPPDQSRPDQSWTLDQSTLSYHMSHPIHEVDGVSHAARGKGVCHEGQCDFLVAAPVKSFDSGDSNRDLHVIQVTRGAEYPLVTVRFRLPQSALTQPTLDCDLEVQFAGNTAHYAHVTFQQSISGAAHHITGVVPSTLSDFKIQPPTFLTVPIKNEIPVRVDMTWRPS
jgi:hypothetical protein